ncbi:MAG: single-stranded DNA-binding protein [Erysipelotrichaceae bacterium]|nr:single-stranded DNA-binding protein [Erysipelotrichaceae bacterium]MDD3924835.1 single-stranded DNA-binding protein [Erysipelotrichaceae bacterium]MDD4642746.1 single-stranded DNA-binding protein [Erysipelotrichaceae bacterium]
MINRVVLVGRLTKDPALRKTQSQTSVVSFTVAINRRFQNQDQTDFINCVAWNKTADFLGRYARKGALVGVEGRIQTRNYDDASGRKVYVTEVVCDNVQLLESKAVAQSREATSDYQDSNFRQDNNNSGYFPDDNGDLDDYSSGPVLDISSDDLPF